MVVNAEYGLVLKTKDNRLRRVAQRQRLTLRKSRRRDPKAFDFGRYWLLNGSGEVVTGGDTGMDIDQIETTLMSPVPPTASRNKSGTQR